jgi:two-component system, NtrC family, response regulator AtoC
MRIVVPPLAERSGEIEPLARLFVEQACRKAKRHAVAISPAALERLRHYQWPGNVRELRNAMERAVVLCRGDAIGVEHLPPECAPHPAAAAPSPKGAMRNGSSPSASMRDVVRTAVSSVERERIVEALAKCAGNQSAAAKMLGISRRTLVARLAEYDIPRPVRRR